MLECNKIHITWAPIIAEVSAMTNFTLSIDTFFVTSEHCILVHYYVMLHVVIGNPNRQKLVAACQV